jgi:hypothetical protein
MKIYNVLFALIALLSCENSARFEVPQPEGESDEKRVPRALVGHYLNVKDSSTLNVSPGLITKLIIADLAAHKSQLDSADRVIFQNDTAFSEIDSNLRVDVVVKGDSVFQHIDYKDTIFSLSRGDVIRKFKGHYFLNHLTSGNNWYVRKLTNGRKGLTLATVSTKEDIEMLRELTGVESDTVYNFRPSKKELRKFLKKKGFSDTDTYIRIQ